MIPVAREGEVTVFPARAGMSLVALTIKVEAFRFPRASGDEPVLLGTMDARAAFSPRERG